MIAHVRTAVALLIFTAIAPVAVLIGCESQFDRANADNVAPAADFDSADLTLWIKRDGKRERLTNILDRAGANQLAAFFAGVGTGHRSDWAGAWIAKVEIEFHRKDGSIVHVNSDLDLWAETNGHGDFPVRGDLRAYVARLFALPDELDLR